MQDNPTIHDTLCITQQTLLPAFSSSMPAPCVPDLNNLVPASPTPRRYILKSTTLPKVLYNERFTIEAFFKLRFPSSIPSPATPKKLLSEQLPFRMSSSHSALSRPSEENKLSTTLHQCFLCLPLRGFTFHSCTKSFLEYRCSGIVATLYHHFNFALSLQPCSESNPMSPLTASLQVLDEYPRTLSTS